METELEAALDLLRRLPPQNIEKNVENLVDLRPELCEYLLPAVDQPLKVSVDQLSGKRYLLSDYNRDGDSFRSPWSNVYDPPLEDGVLPSNRLRRLEVEANEAFEKYTTLYYSNGVSSVYFWDTNHGLAAAVLIKKGEDGERVSSCWDSIHVVDVQEKSSGRSAHYKLTSTILLRLQTSRSLSGDFSLGGSINRQIESDYPISEPVSHIINIGKMIESHENKLRSSLNGIYFGKTKDIFHSLRSAVPLPVLEERTTLCSDLTQVMSSRASKAGEEAEAEVSTTSA